MDKQKNFDELLKAIAGRKTEKMYQNDFFLTWEKTED